jgi:hypothetical protein
MMTDPKKPKIDPQERTIYSTVFEQKEMGKSSVRGAAVYKKYPRLKKRKEEREGDMDKSDANKGYALGEKPKKVMLETAPKAEPKEKKKESALWLGSAPPAQKSLEIVTDMISKAEGTNKAALGSFQITPEGPKQEVSGKPMQQVLGEATKRREAGGGAQLPPPAPTQKAVATGPGMSGGVSNPPSARMGGGVKLSSMGKAQDECPKCGKKDCECVDKALSARSIPRLPRALAAALRADPMRSGAMVLTVPGGTPLHGELLDELPEDSARRDKEQLERSYGVYKSCSGCGRRYLAKSADAECPTCSVNKSMSCSNCGRMLIKSHGGGPATCPICL